MKVLVCGSRDWGDEDAVERRLGRLGLEARPPALITVLHGAASRLDRLSRRQVSADMLADRVARACGYAVRQFPADWRVTAQTPVARIRHRRDGRPYDVGAGRARNLAMLDERPDLVIAFQRDGSRGTQHTIDEARKRGIPVEVLVPQ